MTEPIEMRITETRVMVPYVAHLLSQKAAFAFVVPDTLATNVKIPVLLGAINIGTPLISAQFSPVYAGRHSQWVAFSDDAPTCCDRQKAHSVWFGAG